MLCIWRRLPSRGVGVLSAGWLRCTEIERWIFLWKLPWEKTVRKMVRDISEVHIEVGGSEEFCGLDVV